MGWLTHVFSLNFENYVHMQCVSVNQNYKVNRLFLSQITYSKPILILRLYQHLQSYLDYIYDIYIEDEIHAKLFRREEDITKMDIFLPS